MRFDTANPTAHPANGLSLLLKHGLWLESSWKRAWPDTQTS
jgi:hypothetical protein